MERSAVRWGVHASGLQLVGDLVHGHLLVGSLTLVAVNGLGVLVPVGIPLLISAVVWFARHRQCSRGGPFAGYLAWMLLVVLALGCVVAAASIGLLIAPVALLLGRAAAITPSGPASPQTA